MIGACGGPSSLDLHAIVNAMGGCTEAGDEGRMFHLLMDKLTETARTPGNLFFRWDGIVPKSTISPGVFPIDLVTRQEFTEGVNTANDKNDHSDTGLGSMLVSGEWNTSSPAAKAKSTRLPDDC
jgi:hypothetical protein